MSNLVLILTALYPGSNYNYQARVKNNLTNDLSYSEYSTISLSNYTILPSSYKMVQI